ncbi:MAG: hypothetical protein F6K65_41880 [Moorea sp. SIO3C2]|nr:hypothetical protein [Moorena sp. SIO3C2]
MLCGLNPSVGDTQDTIGGAIAILAQIFNRVARSSAFLPDGIQSSTGIR